VALISHAPQSVDFDASSVVQVPKDYLKTRGGSDLDL
jgi:hypothetical protein